MKKIITFDLDNTLAESKLPIAESMQLVLKKLLEHMQVAIISGGAFEQFEKQVIYQLNLNEELSPRLHLFPTCGTQYYRFEDGDWSRVYLEGMTDEDIRRIINALEKVIVEEGIDKLECYGDRIENRANSQVTFSGFGQKAPLEIKSKFDPDRSRRLRIRDRLLELIPEFSIKIGGTSSIDITKPGIDKAYGIEKMIQYLSITKDEILFVGDELSETGNDYPVKARGVECIETKGPENTINIINKFLDTII